jgi:hypothetical protein
MEWRINTAAQGGAAIALGVATAKSILGVIGTDANIACVVKEVGVFFDGTNSANTPVLVELLKSSQATNSTAGTNNTQVTPTQVRGSGNTSGAGTTPKWNAAANWTSEPTVLTLLWAALVPPTSGLLVQYPLGDEDELPAVASTFAGIILRCNAPQAVNVRAQMKILQGAT